MDETTAPQLKQQLRQRCTFIY